MSQSIGPDPTILTTEQLRRELASLAELINTRLSAMDKATELLNANMTRVPTDTDKQISHLKELHDEKFAGIQIQFRERDVRTDQDKIAATTAVNAALQAQKEAAAAQNQANALSITKSDAATAKQIEDLKSLFNSRDIATGDKINLLGERLTRLESSLAGAQFSRTEKRLDTGSIVGFVSIGISALVVLGGLVTFLSHQAPGNIQPQLPYVAVAPPSK